ncbi:DUF934 domain-containing protein [Falsiroseomonas oryziterrae]|uniref:DUF934 domain-containing protein n=1 Tax=Falsiroseomonas oryziterrae TaxID=2911368 RepID=UPI001F1919B1|nr:DUF934 domain-containing protein [Roseomonas sp. NPKOSM-4]
MPLLEQGRLVADAFVAIADDARLPDGAPALVSLARLQAEATALLARNAQLGVLLPNDTDPSALAPFLHRLSLVALRFPKHRDGRAFTQARALREHHGFAGEIRATGHVLPDQHAFLLRCGFSTVEVAESADLAAWQRGLHAIPIAYQPAVAGDATPLGLLRRHVAVG